MQSLKKAWLKPSAKTNQEEMNGRADSNHARIDQIWNRGERERCRDVYLMDIPSCIVHFLFNGSETTKNCESLVICEERWRWNRKAIPQVCVLKMKVRSGGHFDCWYLDLGYLLFYGPLVSESFRACLPLFCSGRWMCMYLFLCFTLSPLHFFVCTYVTLIYPCVNTKFHKKRTKQLTS